MIFIFLQRFLLKFKNITASGQIFFKKHSSANLKVKGYFVYGAATLGDLSSRQAESRLILEENSQLEVENVTIGRGSRLKVFSGGKVSIGHNTYLADNCMVSISTELTVGRDCAISWDVQFLDDDGHQIENREVKKPIHVGDHVWIGSKAMILKGTTIGEGSVVAAGAVVSGHFPAHSLIGGVPAKVIRENVLWK